MPFLILAFLSLPRFYTRCLRLRVYIEMALKIRVSFYIRELTMFVKNQFYLGKLFTTVIVSQALIFSLPSTAQSELASKATSLPDVIVFNETLEPPGEPEPKGNTSGAGSRDGLRCSPNEKSIRPLMPKNNFGLTLAQHPAISIYLPKTSAKSVALTFKNETGNHYERIFLPITTSGRIVSFSLSKENSPLVVGNNYQWSLVVVCGKTIQPDDPTFKGWVQRVAKTSRMAKELNSKTPIWQAKWYGERGYWYDMLRAMEEAKKAQPQNAQLTALVQKFWESMGGRE